MLSVTNCKLKLLLIIRRKALGEADQTEAAVEFLRDEVTSIFHKEERVSFVVKGGMCHLAQSTFRVDSLTTWVLILFFFFLLGSSGPNGSLDQPHYQLNYLNRANHPVIKSQ